jgi:hypothetical protein
MISLNSSSGNIPQYFMVLRFQEAFVFCTSNLLAAPRIGSVCLKLENYNYMNQLLIFPFALDWSQGTISYASSYASKMFGNFSNP